MIKKVLIGFGLVLAGLILYAAVSPGDFKIERSLEIAATPAQIYPHLTSTRLANAWNPFLAEDPETQVGYEGMESGVGAKTSWSSKKIGEGSAVIIETVPNQKVKVRLDFVKPFSATNIAEYSLESTDNKTRVTWSMSGHSSFIQRFICLFMNQDKRVGEYFEKGLKALEGRVLTTASR